MADAHVAGRLGVRAELWLTIFTRDFDGGESCMKSSDCKRILMSGYPGSGKSTLGAALANSLGFTLISKDVMLMTLYTAFRFGPDDAAASLRTGAASWAVFWMQARLSPEAVLDTNVQWANQHQRDELLGLGGTLLEVRCECPPELAKKRYADRAKVGHAAQRFTVLDDDRLSAYGQAIGIGDLISVDTSGPVDLDKLVAEVRARLDS